MQGDELGTEQRKLGVCLPFVITELHLKTSGARTFTTVPTSPRLNRRSGKSSSRATVSSNLIFLLPITFSSSSRGRPSNAAQFHYAR